MIYPLSGESPYPAPGLNPDDFPIQWSSSGNAVYVWDRSFQPRFIVLISVQENANCGRKCLLPIRLAFYMGEFFLRRMDNTICTVIAESSTVSIWPLGFTSINR